MSFLSGTVSFSRFQVVGGSPKRLDENLIDKFRANRIGSRTCLPADHEEVGWLGGRHLLDAEFDAEKNVILDCLHVGMRIDASRIPPDLMRAYVELELESIADKGANVRSRLRLKRQATDAARGRAEKEIREGRYRRLRQFPLLWDTRDDVLYVGATQPAVLERLHALFKTTFNKRLEQITAGHLSYQWAEKKGADRRLESLRPAKFVEFPGANGHGEVYWTAHDSSSRDFLGNEFLLWLWYTLWTEGDTIKLPDGTEAAVMFVKQLMLECPRAENGKELITCDGPTQLPESRRAIASGKLPRKAGLMVSRQGQQYEFTLQAETFNISSATLPKTETNGNGNGHARAEERAEQIRHLGQTVDLLFQTFLQRRLSGEWQTKLQQMTVWLQTV
ncbi:MAG TPA: hypothetical protein VMV94_12380 [Phycisphaerae bacterium]|nr:hypothetical protein [Phycisphaerae bacterium]